MVASSFSAACTEVRSGRGASFRATWPMAPECGADVQVAQGREPVRAEERSEVKVADGLLVRVVVGQPGEVAVEPAERPVELAFPGPPPGHQTGLPRRPRTRGTAPARAR